MKNFEKILWNEYKKIKNLDFLSKEWLQNLENFEKTAIDYGPAWNNFIQHPVIQQSMFMDARGELMQHQSSLVKKYLPEEIWKKSLQETKIGSPPSVYVDDIFSSHNTIHHNYHIARYVKKLGINNWNNVENIVEWGGGYGNFCRIVKNIKNKLTYSIIDLPIFSLVQYKYLSEIFGEECVAVIEPGQKIAIGKINIISSTYWEQVDIVAEMMVSTWALSETPIYIQEKVFKKNLFNVKNGIFGFHQCGNHIPFMNESSYLKNYLNNNNYAIEDVRVIPGINYYAFK